MHSLFQIFIFNIYIYVFCIVEPILSKITWSIIQPIPDNKNLEVIYVKPTETFEHKKPPLIVYPHGGPHGVITADISLYITTLISLGYVVAIGIYMINFHDI